MKNVAQFFYSTFMMSYLYASDAAPLFYKVKLKSMLPMSLIELPI